ncbi:MAG: DNA internalization-related competence protein ComEC/Rec2 [Deltaproteobacteria bacterium]|nr:DNA internalization-related competence protein ComEC/Rec2 [Deltaproteobacteria bacterium]
MKELRGRPLVAPAIALAMGIATGSALDVFTLRAAAGLFCAQILFLMLVAGVDRSSLRVALAACVAFGVGAATESRLEFSASATGDVTNYVGRDRRDLEGIVCDSPERRELGARAIVCLERIHLPAGAYVPVNGRVMVYAREAGGDVRYGDRVRFESPLRRVRSPGNPGAMRTDRIYREDGVGATGHVRSFAAMRVVARGLGNPARDAVERVRRRVYAQLDANLETPHRELVAALLLGESGPIPRPVRDAYRDAGVAHILAVSGMNMTAVAGMTFVFVFWLLRRVPRLPLHVHAVKVAAASSIVPVVAYAMLAGLSHSVTRAAIMAVMFPLALLTDRVRDLLTAIALAAILILLWKPDALFNVGFQLSFVAVMALVTVIPPAYARWRERGGVLDRRFPTRSRRLADALALGVISSAAALWATAPITAYHFNGFPLYGLLANLLVVPLFTLVIMPLAFASVAALAIHASIAHVVLVATGYAINVGSHMIRAFASLPGAYVRLCAPTTIEIVAWYAIALVPLVRGRTARFAAAGLIVLVFAGNGVLMRLVDRADGDLRIRVVDVGQGLAQLVEFPGGEKILIDGGGQGGPTFDVGERVLAPYLWNRRIRRLDLVVATHVDADHYGGLEFVLRHFDVRELWIGETDLEPLPEGWKRMVVAATDRHIPIRRVSAASSPLVLGDSAVEVLWPPGGGGPTRADDNDRSLVIRVTHGANALLLPADLTAPMEELLLAAGRDVRSDVLVVSHHGAANGSGEALLAAARPTHAIVSAGYANRHGHPSPEALRRLTDVGATIWRTDRDGLVTCRGDGVSVRCDGTRPAR